MGKSYVDRYENFKSDENYKPVPGIKIPEKSTDIYLPYKLGSSRLDVLSQKYYQSPYFGWLIMLSNPQFGGLEFNIPDNSIIRVPFPLKTSVNDYFNGIDIYLKLYG